MQKMISKIFADLFNLTVNITSGAYIYIPRTLIWRYMSVVQWNVRVANKHPISKC